MKEFTRLYSTFCIIITIQWAGNIHIYIKYFFLILLSKPFYRAMEQLIQGYIKLSCAKRAFLRAVAT